MSLVSRLTTEVRELQQMLAMVNAGLVSNGHGGQEEQGSGAVGD